MTHSSSASGARPRIFQSFQSFQVFKSITEQRKEKISALERMSSMYLLFLQSRWQDKNFEPRISGSEDIYRAAL